MTENITKERIGNLGIPNLGSMVLKEEKRIKKKNPHMLKHFKRIGGLSKDTLLVKIVNSLSRMIIPGYERQTLTFLCVDEGEFEYYSKSNKLVIPNSNIDVYNSDPSKIFYNNPTELKKKLNEARKHEGIFVFNTYTNEIIHNGVFLKVSHDKMKVYREFSVENDYELIQKTGYLSDLLKTYGERAELGSKSKAILYFSKVNNATFMRFNNNCYIIKNGNVKNSKKHDEFKTIRYPDNHILK